MQTKNKLKTRIFLDFFELFLMKCMRKLEPNIQRPLPKLKIKHRHRCSERVGKPTKTQMYNYIEHMNKY